MGDEDSCAATIEVEGSREDQDLILRLQWLLNNVKAQIGATKEPEKEDSQPNRLPSIEGAWLHPEVLSTVR